MRQTFVQALYGHQNAMSLKDEVASRVLFGDSGKKLKPLKEFLKSNQCVYKMKTAILYHGTAAKHEIFLKSNQCVYKMKTAILYHGTAAKHEICEQGIRKTTSKTKGSLQSSEGFKTAVKFIALYRCTW